jgi:ribosomal protein L32
MKTEGVTMVDHARQHPDDEPADDHPVHDADALVPMEHEEKAAPPVDIDDRQGDAHSNEVIEMPETGVDGPAHTSRWADTIDELIPLPQDEPYHDDDAEADDPFDTRDQVDMHLPLGTRDAADEVDDFSTREEVDVDNAPGGTNPDHDSGVADGSAAPDEDHPVNEESGFYGSSFSTTVNPADDVIDDASFTDLGPATAEAPSRVDGTVICPTCGRQTDALRFCGHCGGPLTERRREIAGDTQAERLMNRAASYLEPLALWTRPGGVRAILAIGVLLVLVSLLANSGAMAIIVGASILPAVILYWCRRVDVFEQEPWYYIAGFAIVGVVTGALLGWLGAITTTGAWFDDGVLNFGAAGYGGRFAEAAGNAPFIVWLVCGVIIPIAALAAIIAGPLLMRQTISLRNEVMDGLTLAAAMGGGYAIGTATVFVAPIFGQDGPAISASGWTLTTIGLTILRPLLWTLAGGMIGAAAWRYLLSGKLASALVPAAAGIAAPLLATLLSIQLAPTGLWAEIALGAVVAIAVVVMYQRTLTDAIRQDRGILGADDARVVCPNCQRVTPAGQYCAHCGQELQPAAA